MLASSPVICRRRSVEPAPVFWSPDYNDGWNHLWPQISCDAWQSGNGGHYCNERVELLEQARNAADEESYFSSLKEINRS